MSGDLGDLPDRFAAKVSVDPNTGCWRWTAATRNGYGACRVDGQQWGAHRYAYAVLVGPPPERPLVLDHLCRNRACVNPDHLEIVTNKENILRGVGWSGLKSRVTHCPRGHELVDSNLVPSEMARGRRSCLACAREHAKRISDLTGAVARMLGIGRRDVAARYSRSEATLRGLLEENGYAARTP